MQKFGYGAAGVAAIVGMAVFGTWITSHGDVRIDQALFIEEAIEAGYVAPAEVAMLQERLDRAQSEIDGVLQSHPDLKPELSRAIDEVNAGDPNAARAAFATAEKALAPDDASARIERAHLMNAQATLLYPFKISKAEPLLCRAAELAETSARYWFECGYARYDTGKLDLASDAFERAVASTKGNRGDLSAVLVGLGDVRRDQGDLAGAVAAYNESLESAREIVALEPASISAAGQLATSLTRIGHVRIDQNDVAGGLAAYEESLEISRNLAARNPDNAELARKVVIGLDNVGDTLKLRKDFRAALAAYDEGLRVARELAAGDPRNADWAREVSIGLDNVGDVLADKGDLHGALNAYEESLEIMRGLTAHDSGNTEWARDLSVSLNRVGDVLGDQGNLPAASYAYREALEIRLGLVSKDPDNASWVGDLWYSYERLAEVDPESAAALLPDLVRQMEDMADRGLLSKSDLADLKAAREDLAAAR